MPAVTTRTTAILLGAALALASVPELPVGVRLVFQAAEELMPRWARSMRSRPVR